MTTLVPYIITFIFIVLGLLLAGAAKKWFDIDNSALFASLIFAPIVAYLVLSGQLMEFKGFGLEAKFREAATKSVQTSPVKTTTISPTSDSIKDLTEKSMAKAFFSIGSEVVLLKVPKNREKTEVGVREAFQVAHQIYPSLLQGIFQFLVVLDESDHVLGYFEKEFFSDILRIEIEQTIRGKRTVYQKERVEEQLQQTGLWDIVENPRMRADTWGVKETIRIDTSNLEALRTMREKNLRAIVVVDGQGKYKGIVNRNDIVSDLLSNLYKLSAQ